METNEHHMIPIWFIIGINLLVYGVVIAITGLVHWSNPPVTVELSDLHIDFWWGLLMTVLGLFYTLRFRPGKTEK
ncbi:MAG TPA: hypothetical protein VFB27_10855 [Opitutaceae bacterium]|nr:hypothetical protein [Opitutaceae bacterium]